MTKTVVIHQPNFLPRIKVLIKIMLSDVWVIYDNVQYVRREWQNRVFLRDSQQREVLFTAATQKADFHEQINRILLYDTIQQNKRLEEFVQYNYSNTPYYDWIRTYVLNISSETKNVSDLSTYNIISTNIALHMLDVQPKEILASKHQMRSNGRNEKLIELCKVSGCGNYICGSGGKTYINEQFFNSCGINVIYYDYSLIQGCEGLDMNSCKNKSFIDFIAYNGPERLIDIVNDVKEKQIVDHIKLI